MVATWISNFPLCNMLEILHPHTLNIFLFYSVFFLVANSHLIKHLSELTAFQFICLTMPTFLLCITHVTPGYFNFCAVPFITFTFDEDTLLIWRAAIPIHVLSKLLVLQYYIKLIVKLIHQIHLKTRVIFRNLVSFLSTFA